MSAHEKVRELISAYMDDELTQQEGQTVRVHLETCDECRRTLDQLRTLQEATSATRFREPTEEEMEKLEERMSVQVPRKAGWLLLLMGFAVWAIYGVYLFLTDPDLMTFENLSAGAIVVGMALLLISVLRQRLLELPHDRYRGVKK